MPLVRFHEQSSNHRLRAKGLWGSFRVPCWRLVGRHGEWVITAIESGRISLQEKST